jgi:hypothetical protein
MQEAQQRAVQATGMITIATERNALKNLLVASNWHGC